MSITVRFVCGHASAVGVNATSDPVCPTCGETRIARTSAPPPRFTGACAGPYAVTSKVDPASVRLAPPLRLKESV